jgi:tetrathionate reductase subunit A
MSKQTPTISPTRRTFLKMSGVVGAAAAGGSLVFTRKSEALSYTQQPPDEVETAADIIYSVCQMCHARCGIRAKVKNGVLVKIDGNPYHPNTKHMDERPDYATDPASDAILKNPGRMCPKGQAGIQTVYDPYRITQPLRRVGARGSGKWEAIDWNTAFAEIAAKINAIIPIADRWTKDVDPSEPKLGKLCNQLVFSPGRSIEKDLSTRIFKGGYSTVNYDVSHTSICEVSRHVANELITWDHNKSSTSLGGAGGGKNRYGAGRTNGWQADIASASYVVLWGSNLCEAGFPMQYAARNIVRLRERGAKLVVVDPRFSNTAAKADRWIPVKPGGDQSLALGVLRWMLENGKYDGAYLANANKAAANADNQTTWTDATYLVGDFLDSNGKPYSRYLTGEDLGSTGGSPKLEYAVWDGAAPVIVGSAALEGQLEPAIPDLTLSGGPAAGKTVTVRTAFQKFKAGVLKYSMAVYSADAGIKTTDIVALATELTAGTPADWRSRPVITYRGPVKHTNGVYAQMAIQHINTLLGNYDWKGGVMAGAGGPSATSAVVQLDEVAGSPKTSGVTTVRSGKVYDPIDAGSLFKGYPALRPWGPFWTHSNYQEALPSAADAYPYATKVLITYWNAWPYATPATRTIFEQLLADESLVELFVAISPVMGEVAARADYILPDSTYLEKFGLPGIPWNASGGTAIQRPVVGDFGDASTGTWSPITAQIDTTKKNDYRPVLPNTKAVLDIYIGLAKALGLDGTISGPNGPVKAVGAGALVKAGAPAGPQNLHNGWDWAHSILQNLSASSGRPISEIVARGGVFWDKHQEYDNGPNGSAGTHMAGQYGNIIRLFSDPLARTRDSITGQYYLGVPERTEIAHSDGTPLDKTDAAWPYRLITYKSVDQGQARTNVNAWLMLRRPENTIDISASDAATLGIETGDRVRVSSASNLVGIIGRANVTQGIRPGVIGVSHHYGHWEQGARPYLVKSASGSWTTVQGDPTRGAGVNANLIMRLDQYNANTTLQDLVGGSACFFDTRVAVEKLL